MRKLTSLEQAQIQHKLNQEEHKWNQPFIKKHMDFSIENITFFPLIFNP